MEDYQAGMGHEHQVVCLARLLVGCTEEIHALALNYLQEHFHLLCRQADVITKQCRGNKM